MTTSPSIADRLKPDTTFKVSYDDNPEPRFLVGYWSIRGLGAPFRMMLSAAQVNHWVLLYDVREEQPDGWDKSSYQTDKKWIKEELNPFMNLPFLVDCNKGIVVCQTNAIMTYLGRQLGLLGSTPEEESKCEELLCEIYDLRNKMVNFAYGKGDDKQDAQQLKNSMGSHLAKLEAHLGNEDHTYLVGNAMSAPDFHVWEMLDQGTGLCEHFDLPAFLESFPNLQNFYKQFAALPQNKAYLESFLAKDLPYNNPYGRFGSDPASKGPYKRGQETPWQQKGIVESQRIKVNAPTDDNSRKRKLEATTD